MGEKKKEKEKEISCEHANSCRQCDNSHIVLCKNSNLKIFILLEKFHNSFFINKIPLKNASKLWSE